MREGDRRRLTAIDLFCGAGGMALGFERAGFDVLAAVDLDPVHLAAHERNFPLCEPLCADIAETDPSVIMGAARRGWRRRHPGTALTGVVDCVFGGPSCQGFSVIGPRDPADARNALVSQFARIVGGIRPRWFVMENVPGLASRAYRHVLRAFYDELEAAGYELTDPWILNASDHGVPQERKRLFVLGARAAEPLPQAPQPTRAAPTVEEAIGDLKTLTRISKLYEYDALELTETQLASMRSRQTSYVRRVNGTPRERSDQADPRAWNPRLVTSVGLTVHSEAVMARFRRLRRGERDEIGRLPKLDPTRQSPTLRAGTGRDHGSFTSARPVHYSSPRVITVREAARLHGFPDWFGFHATKWHGFRQVGNAVPPPLARAVAQAVVIAACVGPSRRHDTVLDLGPAALLAMPMAQAASYYGLDPAKLPANVRAAAARQREDAA
jgi:DNA (cytosine-5)-methyltransferase 1